MNTENAKETEEIWENGKWMSCKLTWVRRFTLISSKLLFVLLKIATTCVAWWAFANNCQKIIGGNFLKKNVSRRKGNGCIWFIWNKSRKYYCASYQIHQKNLFPFIFPSEHGKHEIYEIFSQSSTSYASPFLFDVQPSLSMEFRFIRAFRVQNYYFPLNNYILHNIKRFMLDKPCFLTWVRRICIILIFSQILISDFLKISERGTSEMIFFIPHNILE